MESRPASTSQSTLSMVAANSADLISEPATVWALAMSRFESRAVSLATTKLIQAVKLRSCLAIQESSKYFSARVGAWTAAAAFVVSAFLALTLPRQSFLPVPRRRKSFFWTLGTEDGLAVTSAAVASLRSLDLRLSFTALLFRTRNLGFAWLSPPRDRRPPAFFNGDADSRRIFLTLKTGL